MKTYTIAEIEKFATHYIEWVIFPGEEESDIPSHFEGHHELLDQLHRIYDHGLDMGNCDTYKVGEIKEFAKSFQPFSYADHPLDTIFQKLYDEARSDGYAEGNSGDNW